MIHDGEQLLHSGGEEAYHEAKELGQDCLFLGDATMGSGDGKVWFQTDADYDQFYRRYVAARRLSANAAIELALIHHRAYLNSPSRMGKMKVEAQKYAKLALAHSARAFEIVEEEPSWFTKGADADLHNAELEAHLIWEEYPAVLVGVEQALERHPEDERFRDLQWRIEAITGRSVHDDPEEIMGCPPS